MSCFRACIQIVNGVSMCDVLSHLIDSSLSNRNCKKYYNIVMCDLSDPVCYILYIYMYIEPMPQNRNLQQVLQDEK